MLCYVMGFYGGSDLKESACRCGRPGFDSEVGSIPWRREWQTTPVFLPVKYHRQRNLAGYSPQSCKESDMTEWLTLSVFTMLWKNPKEPLANSLEWLAKPLRSSSAFHLISLNILISCISLLPLRYYSHSNTHHPLSYYHGFVRIFFFLQNICHWCLYSLW